MIDTSGTNSYEITTKWKIKCQQNIVNMTHCHGNITKQTTPNNMHIHTEALGLKIHES